MMVPVARRTRGASALAALLILLISLAGCTLPQPVSPASPASVGNVAGDRELTPVQLGVGYVPNVQFAPIYVGLEKGFFADEGIELSLEYGYENDYLTLVGTGKYDFMVGSGDQVILGRSQGLPVRYIYNWYSRYPVVLFAKEDADITTPSDMAGKRIGLPGTYGANYVALRALLDAGGLTEKDIQVDSIGFTQAAAVSEGKVDAAVDYAVNGPVVLQQAGIPITQIGLDGYLTIPANGLITNDKTIADQPELVAALVRALDRSVAYTIANPDEAFAISLGVVPEAGGANEAANRAVFDASLEFWRPVAERPAGSTRADDWAAAADFMTRVGLAPNPVPVEDLYTNDFVPSMH